MASERLSAARRLLAAAAAVLLVAVPAACADDPYAPLPRPETSSTLAVTSTSVADFTSVPLAPVDGSTTTTLAMGPGSATLEGVVTAPEGPLPGATVHIERLVRDAVVVQDVLTGPDGTWRLENVLGGRFRVRAWLAPTHAQVEPQLFFLDGTSRRELRLQVQAFGGTEVTHALAPSEPEVDQLVNLVVRVAARGVGVDGIVRTVPLPDRQVSLTSTGRWRLHTPNTVVTDAAGRAPFTLTCLATGPQPLTAVLDNVEPHPLAIPECDRPPPATTSTSTPSTTEPG